ncbi:YadA-like family protein [Burkholderia arboris]|uniref:YadA-like family protein n=1 Tax=Burkholderia arboris TaxID=488730 RepID=UPI00158AB8C5|nr:YadA-like family protein [Burkholderia arboris]
MNKIYKTIWNESVRAWIVVHENAAACGKPARSARRRVSGGLLVLGIAASGFAPGASAQVTMSGTNQGFGIGSTSRGSNTCVAIGASGSSNAVTNCGGADALALGNGATATGATSIAVGYSANAINNGDLALGASSFASGGAGNLSAVAVGRGSTAVGEDALAVGNSASAQVNYGAAVGNFATVSARNALAVGNSSIAGGVAATAIGNFATATGTNAVAIGGGGVPGAFVGAQAAGVGAVAIGGNLVRAAAASATDGIALGGQASVAAGANSGIAIGRGASIAGAATYGIAQGDGATANQANDIAIGLNAATSAGSGGNNIAVGNGVTTGSSGQNVAMGSGGTTAGAGSASGGAVAIGRGQKAIGDGAVALGDPNTANGTGAVALGANNVAAGDTAGNSAAAGAVAIGSGNQAIGQGAVALGNASSATAGGALALGDTAQATAQNAIAFGSHATASQAGSVALGANAIADGSTLGNAAYNPGSGVLAGTSPAGEASVGGSGAERRITHVAAGSGDTDAVNVSQLKSLGTSVNTLGGTTASAIGGGASYDPATGRMTSPTYNIAGGQQTTISDAINALNEGWNVTTSGNASGTSVAAIKPGATMTVDGGKNIALTQNGSTISIATSDTPTFTSVGIDNGGPVLSGSGLNMAGQKITNVAPGDVSSTSTDAVNGAQLNDTNRKIQQASDQAVKYDTNPDGSINYNSVTMNPGGTPAKVTNVAAGDVSATSTDAVNGSQLNDTNQNVTKLGDTLNNIAGDTSQSYTDQNGAGIRYARTNEAGLAQTDAFAQAPGSTAVGYAATASADNALALGRQATASHAGSVALGANSIANGSTLGHAAYNPGTGTLAGTNPVGEVSVGGSGAERRITNVAAGSADTDAVNVSQLKSVETSVGNVSDRAVKYDGNPGDPKTQITLDGPASTDGGKTGGTKITNVAQGDVSATSTDAVNGAQLNETNGNVTKLGDTLTHIAGDTSQSYTDQNGTGIRYARTNEAGLAQTDAFAQAPGSTAVGYAATASADDALALGRQATASHAGSVALGASAVANGSTLGHAAYNPGTGTLAGTNPVGDVSVGGSGAERRITNVAAGADDTDAVNVSQLNSLQTRVGDLSAGAVKYDRNPDGTIDYTHVTMNPGGAPTTITNVAAGALSATSTDAVNGSQLYETNQNVTRLGDQVDTIANGGGIKYFHANGGTTPLPDSQANGAGSAAMGPAANANGVNSVAIGNGAVANKGGDVALGAGSVADRGAEQYTGKYSGAQNSTAGTVSVGAPGAERTVSNVADGRQATDAVNVRQLDGAVKEANDYTDQQVQKVAGDVVNVGDDVRKLGDRMTNVEGDVTSVKNGSGGMFQVSQDRTPAAPAASGSNAVAGGAGAVASGANSTALGNQASATGGNSTAIGNGANASGSNSVALGAGSDGSRDNAVSMGAAGRERQIVNVAPGTAGTDAVNVNQLRAMEHGLGSQIAGVRSDMQSLDHRLTAGVAAAMAMAGLPQAYQPGKSMVALGGGAWRGESGVALGLSTVSDNGNWVLKGSASSTSRGDLGASVGVGYQW